MKPLNKAFLLLSKRAETSARETLVQTFVDVGPLFSLLSTHNHQVVFGRRGTGKTHALEYLAGTREKLKDAVATIDLRNVGSSAGLYADETLPISERATRLLVDTLSAIHSAVLKFCIEGADMNLAMIGPVLDELADAITQVRVIGDVTTEKVREAKITQTGSTSVHGGFSGGTPTIAIFTDTKDEAAEGAKSSISRAGREAHYVNFGSTGTAFRRLIERLGGVKLWVLLDEWSSVPLPLQPYLADLIRRSLFPVQGIIVKIAAIEHRSEFQIRRPGSNDYIGIELGADAAADVNFDDFMVFDNDPVRAKEFFQDLIARHVDAAVNETDLAPQVPQTADALMKEAFTEKRAIEEFVRACEGVPRDAVNILALAAQHALTVPISVQHVRTAARNWYQRDKEKAVAADENSNRLLHAIISDVIGERRARAFLLRSDCRSPMIDALYDARVLHILKRGVSTHDQPGVRFNVYKLDYGCYVDLLVTQQGPLGLLPGEDDSSGYIDVPVDDYRSIRRAILDLDSVMPA